MPESATSDVRNNADRQRYEIYVENELAGFAQYSVRSERIIITHTEVFDQFEGQGLAGQIIRFALDDIRAQGLDVVPICPYAAAYIDKHPEYDDLVDDEAMAVLARKVKR